MLWLRFTERARRVIFYAYKEAQQLGESEVNTEHLLLGLVRESDSIAVRILERLGVSPQRIRNEIERYAIRGGARSSGEMSLAQRAKRVIDLAYDEARQFNNNYIGTEHLLLGLIREGEGLAARILQKLGADLERAREAAKSLREESAPPPSRARAPKRTEFGLNLNWLAQERQLEPAYERDSEIHALLQILAKPDRAHALLVGERGVGKTTIVHGLVNLLVYGEPLPPLSGAQVMALTPYTLMLHARTPERATQLLDELTLRSSEWILYLDDMETLFELSQDDSDPLLWLKQILSLKGVRFVGVYNTGNPQDSERLSHLKTLFTVMTVGEMTPEATVRVLYRKRPEISRQLGVAVSDEAIERAVAWSVRYLPDRRLPEKAIDLLVSAATRASLGTSLLPPTFCQQIAAGNLPERGAQESLFDYLRRLLERLRELQPASSLEQQMLQEQRQYLIQLIERLSAGNAVLALTPAEVAQQLHEWTGIPVEQIMAD